MHFSGVRDNMIATKQTLIEINPSITRLVFDTIPQHARVTWGASSLWMKSVSIVPHKRIDVKDHPLETWNERHRIDFPWICSMLDWQRDDVSVFSYLDLSGMVSDAPARVRTMKPKIDRLASQGLTQDAMVDICIRSLISSASKCGGWILIKTPTRPVNAALCMHVSRCLNKNLVVLMQD